MMGILDARKKARLGAMMVADDGLMRAQKRNIAFIFIFTFIYFLQQSAPSQCDLQAQIETNLLLKLLTKPLKLSRRFSTQGARSVTFEGSRALE